MSSRHDTRCFHRLSSLAPTSVLFLLLSGFLWEGRVARWRRELGWEEPERRREIVRTLADHDSPEIRNVLFEALGDSDARVRVEAVKAMGRLQLRDAAPRLIESLADADVNVRKSAVETLGVIGAPAS